MSARPGRARGLRLAPFVLAWLLAGGAIAHPLAPALFAWEETGSGRFDVVWKTPRQLPAGSDLRPELPAHCRRTGGGDAVAEGASLVVRFPVECGAQGLAGARLAVRGLETSGTNALVRVAWRDGRRVQAVVHAGDPELRIDEAQGAFAVATAYAPLGFGHILSGLDHLLFVFGLLLLVGTLRQLVATVTSFTLGHSVTLSLAALGFVAFPTALVEVLIALTLVALALELARPAAGSDAHWMRRAPWAMAFGFGLLHGLGFAGALAEVGLPSDEIPAALLAFNLGIEAGQLAFVALVLALRALLANPIRQAPAWALRAPVYAMGGLAVYWCLDRGAGLFS